MYVVMSGNAQLKVLYFVGTETDEQSLGTGVNRAMSRKADKAALVDVDAASYTSLGGLFFPSLSLSSYQLGRCLFARSAVGASKTHWLDNIRLNF